MSDSHPDVLSCMFARLRFFCAIPAPNASSLQISLLRRHVDDLSTNMNRLRGHVPVDLSPHSAPALDMAAQIAPQAKIAIVHAFDVLFEGKLWRAGVEESEIQRYRDQAMVKAKEQIASLVHGLGNTSLRAHQFVEHGDAARIILEQEELSNPDLIVIGKHRQSTIGDLLLGSVARHVLSYARCDVLVVNQ